MNTVCKRVLMVISKTVACGCIMLKSVAIILSTSECSPNPIFNLILMAVQPLSQFFIQL